MMVPTAVSWSVDHRQSTHLAVLESCLPKVFAVLAELDNAAVAVAVSDKERAIPAGIGSERH